jgi:hypothetical protein
MARSATVMRKLLLILSVLCCCTGCATREPQLYKVVDSTDLQPVGGAEVWMQPWAPIHPFWPAGDRGTTDANGEVTLSLPHGFWFYFWGVKADGYTEVKDPDEVKAPARWLQTSPGTQNVFFMRRDTARGATNDQEP